MERLPAGIWSADDDLQALRARAERGVWERLFRELAARGRSSATQIIDSTQVTAHRSASGAKRGSTSRLLAAHAAAETRKSTQSQMRTRAPLAPIRAVGPCWS